MMRQAGSLALVAVISGIATLAILNRKQAFNSRPAQSRDRVPYPYSTAYRYQRQLPYQQVYPPQRTYQELPQHHRNSRASRYRGLSRKVGYGQGTSRQEGTMCRNNPSICGAGFFCCFDVCIRAVFGKITFAADDAGALMLCHFKAVETFKYTEVGKYDGPIPCTDIFIDVTNTNLEGGVAVAVEPVDFPPFGSGTDLPVDSKTTGAFNPVENFTALNNVFPYSDLIRRFGAYPVKDPFDSFNSAFTFRFFPPVGC